MQHVKWILLERFTNGDIKVLFTTEATGMVSMTIALSWRQRADWATKGCDLPNIELVVQFMVPANLSIWMQQAGRAGQSPMMQARAILLVQPTVFQEKREKKVLRPGDGAKSEVCVTMYVKQVEDGLHAWLETWSCRRDVADHYFASCVKCKCE